MGQSLAQMYIHLTFGTKNRYPFIGTEIKKRLHSYLSGTLNKYDCPVICINSTADHVHILFRLSKTHTLAKMVEELKKQSSKWIKEIEGGHSKFAWQTGYGAFSVSSSKLNNVIKYIENQEKHHKTKTYLEEVEEFLRQYGLKDYDPSYYWS